MAKTPQSRPRRPRATERWFELLLASRLLRSRRSAHLSLVTSMSVAGIALGVAALIVVLAVNTGFQTAFQDRILATYPHLVVMRRGVDVHDWRSAIQRLARAPGVRSAAPATYDDMMLAAAVGRAGAVVRGVPPEALAGMPEGSVVAGKLDVVGERPAVETRPEGLRLGEGVAGGRHAIVTGTGSEGRWSHLLTVLPVPSGLGGVVVFDARGCPGAEPAGGADAALYLSHPDTTDPLRSAEPLACAVAGSWDMTPGAYDVRWQHAGVQQRERVRVPEGATTVLVLHGDRLHRVPAPPSDLPATAAGAAVVAIGQGAEVTAPDRPPIRVEGVGPWQPLPARLPAIALGEGLASRLQVKVGDEVRAVSPLRGLDRIGDTAAGSAMGRFRVATLLRTGFHDHDQRLALVDFHAAQRFLGRGDIARWIEVRVEDPILASAQVDVFRAALEPTSMYELLTGVQALRDRFVDLQESSSRGLQLRAPRDAVAFVDNQVSALRAARHVRVRGSGAWRVLDWEEMNRNIFDAARMQKVAMSLFPFIIVLVAALNVVGTQAVVVHERAREIAILRAMGSTRRSVAAVFLSQGLAVGLTGTIIGLAVGGLACLALDAIGYPLDPQVYLISRLPVQTEPAAFLLAGGAATVLAFAAAWFSAQRAASRAPVDALRRLD